MDVGRCYARQHVVELFRTLEQRVPGGRRRMNPFRDATPRPRCTKCGLRRHRCLCKPAFWKTEKEPPNLDKTPGQQSLPIGDHAGSRVAYWMRWMRTTGIREGLTVEPDKNQSSQANDEPIMALIWPKNQKPSLTVSRTGRAEV